MKNNISKEIEERQIINQIIKSYLRLDHWTPAMGALLVSGISPLPDVRKIQAGGALLSNPSIAAKPVQLLDAQRVLRDWIDFKMDEDEIDAEQAIGLDVNPGEFIEWCLETYNSQAHFLRPGWLDHWLAYYGLGANSHFSVPAPRKLIERASDLEGLASVVNTQSVQKKYAALEKNDSKINERYVDQMTRLINDGAKTPISKMIIMALNLADHPENPTSVWIELCKLAKARKHTALTFESETLLKIPHSEAGEKNYNKSSLSRFLNRYKNKLKAI